jgi:protein O-mannosyl-transferase
MSTPAAPSHGPVTSPTPPWRALLPGAAAIAVAAVAAYANSLDVPFVFDDLPNIVDEPAVHLLRADLEGLGRAASGFPAGRWLARLSLALNFLVGGLEPLGYHLVNLAAHLAASLLAGLLVLEVLGRLPPGQGVPPAARGRTALVAALLFAVHPVQTQAVTYVVQRMTSMGGAFALLACWLFLRARREGARAAPLLLGAAASGYLAFACKETYVVLPLLAAVLEWLLVPGLGARLRARWRPALAAALAGLALAAALAWRYADVLASEHVRFGIALDQRLLSQGSILLHYLSLLALPLPGRLHMDYYWQPARGLLDPPTTLPALLLVAGLATGAVALRRRAPLFALAGLWFLAGLSVEQSVLPIDLVFEHRLYLPALGLFLLAAVGLERAAAALPALAARPHGAWLVAGPLVALLGAGTVARNEVWRDPAVLYADEVGSGPGASRGLLTLGMRLRVTGRLEEAAAVLRRALTLEPDNLGARVNLANVIRDQGDLAAAERLYRETTELAPAWGPGWHALGVYLLNHGRPLEARLALEQAAALLPGDASLVNSLGVARARTGDPAGALAAYERAIQLDPGQPLPWLNRGEQRLTSGDAAGALSDGRTAQRLSQPTPTLLAFLGDAAAAAGLLAEARDFYQRALALDPSDPRARRGLARLNP